MLNTGVRSLRLRILIKEQHKRALIRARLRPSASNFLKLSAG